MRVLVLGGGVVGTASAYYLARAGFEVVVVDRQPAVAMETSFANAGQVSPGYASPWAAPGVPLKAIKWLLQHGYAPQAAIDYVHAHNLPGGEAAFYPNFKGSGHNVIGMNGGYLTDEDVFRDVS